MKIALIQWQQSRSTEPVTNLNEDFRPRIVDTIRGGFTVDPAPGADIPGSMVRDDRFQRRDMDAERGRIVADDHSEPVAPDLRYGAGSASLPMFVLAVSAGALADIVNRRTLLLITQLWMLGAGAALSVTTYAGAMSLALLLLLTFLLGIGTAVNRPAWQLQLPT